MGVPPQLPLGYRSSRLGEFLDLVGAEPGPVVLVGDDDGGLHVAEGADALQGGRILGQVNALVRDALLVKSPVGSVALNAGWLGVNRDSHDPSSPWETMRMSELFRGAPRCSHGTGGPYPSSWLNTTSSAGDRPGPLDDVLQVCHLSPLQSTGTGDIPAHENRGNPPFSGPRPQAVDGPFPSKKMPCRGFVGVSHPQACGRA